MQATMKRIDYLGKSKNMYGKILNCDSNFKSQNTHRFSSKEDCLSKHPPKINIWLVSLSQIQDHGELISLGSVVISQNLPLSILTEGHAKLRDGIKFRTWGTRRTKPWLKKGHCQYPKANVSKLIMTHGTGFEYQPLIGLLVHCRGR